MTRKFTNLNGAEILHIPTIPTICIYIYVWNPHGKIQYLYDICVLHWMFFLILIAMSGKADVRKCFEQHLDCNVLCFTTSVFLTYSEFQFHIILHFFPPAIRVCIYIVNFSSKFLSFVIFECTCAPIYWNRVNASAVWVLLFV